MEIKSEADALRIFEKLVQKVLPDILLKGQQNLKAGRVIAIDNSTTSRQVSVQIFGSVEIYHRLPLARGISNVKPGDIAVVFSVDPKVRSQNFVIAVI
jgi:hypothetical protein